jgi:hypothetical protein
MIGCRVVLLFLLATTTMSVGLVAAVVLTLVLAVCLAVKCLWWRAANKAVPSPDENKMDVTATVIMETAANTLIDI